MKHFTISEMLKSDTALKHALWNGATKEAEENLKALIESILDPLRELYGRPIHVTSGYRCPKLNRLVGGAPNSQHMRGEAADILAYVPASGVGPSTLRPGSATAGSGTSSPSMSSGTLVSSEENKKLGQIIETLGNFDQLIYEQCDKQGNPCWIHVSYKRNGWNRRNILKKVAGKAGYVTVRAEELV